MDQLNSIPETLAQPIDESENTSLTHVISTNQLEKNKETAIIISSQSDNVGVHDQNSLNQIPTLAKESVDIQVHQNIAIENVNNQMNQKSVSTVDSNTEKILSENDIILLFQNELKDYPQVFIFIQKLQQLIERQRTLLYTYREKYKQNKKVVQHVEIQVDTEDLKNNVLPMNENGVIDVDVFKQEIVEAAHNAVQQTGFVYEPVSGLYYDYSTGYYYNSELGLYYDGATSCYYYFNEKEKKFEFHSQVQVPKKKMSKEEKLAKASGDIKSNINHKGVSKTSKQGTSSRNVNDNMTSNPVMESNKTTKCSNYSQVTKPTNFCDSNSSQEVVLKRKSRNNKDEENKTQNSLLEDCDMLSDVSSNSEMLDKMDSDSTSLSLTMEESDKEDGELMSSGEEEENEFIKRIKTDKQEQNEQEEYSQSMAYKTSLEYYNSKEYREYYENYCKSITVEYSKTPVTYDPNSEEAKLINPALRTEEYEIANAWPPCLRIVVKETSVRGLQTGTLFIVTYLGGTIGREGEHAIILPDINISKHHAKIVFTGTEDNKADPTKGYVIVDLGSRNGTYIDDVRLSVALQESEPHLMKHNSILRIGATKLLVHIHNGRDTCDDCEPGLLMEPIAKVPVNKIDLKESAEEKRSAEMKRLRRKFGLDKNSNKATKVVCGYEDRAEIRRKTVGSHVEGEKTQVANINEKIPNQNKGFQMLSKMGWKSGQTLGKDEANTSALTEPIIPQKYSKNAGLGSGLSSPPPMMMSSSNKRLEKKTTVWKKAQKRYSELGDEAPS